MLSALRSVVRIITLLYHGILIRHDRFSLSVCMLAGKKVNKRGCCGKLWSHDRTCVRLTCRVGTVLVLVYLVFAAVLGLNMLQVHSLAVSLRFSYSLFDTSTNPLATCLLL